MTRWFSASLATNGSGHTMPEALAPITSSSADASGSPLSCTQRRRPGVMATYRSTPTPQDIAFPERLSKAALPKTITFSGHERGTRVERHRGVVPGCGWSTARLPATAIDMR
jgi:hypothetical protein